MLRILKERASKFEKIAPDYDDESGLIQPLSVFIPALTIFFSTHLKEQRFYPIGSVNNPDFY